MQLDVRLKQLLDSKGFCLAMLCCVIGYILFKRSYRDVGDVFQTLFILASVAALFVDRKQLFKDKMLWALGFAIITQLLSWANALIDIPDLAYPSPHIADLADLFIFIFVAYWLKGTLLNVYLSWWALCLGMLLAFYSHSDITQQVLLGLEGVRIDFNIINAQHPAMYSGVGFLLSSFFFMKYLCLSIRAQTAKNIALLCSATLLLVAFTFVVVTTQSRQVWVALLAAYVLGTLLYSILHQEKINKLILVGAFSLLGLAFYTYATIPLVHDRVQQEMNTATTIITNGDISKIPFNSAGTRLHLWHESLKWIKERPLLGSGYNSKVTVIQNAQHFPAHIRQHFTHLHNSHIELLVSYGLVGLLLMYGVFAWVVRAASVAPEKRGINEVLLISAMFTVYWLTVNLFESFFFSNNGQWIHNVMLGSCYTFYLTYKLSPLQSKEPIPHD
ncbi:O-antigen ligase family protein [Photobacterium atrarenae]|uniref:O-antigen ligase family protein n=1 Tax=Photobacterium atrarenae TaxID=865757 RepID=A0ABY5GF77_9GAMM|nr:O-antigen ligase family protein [Photobacterium atrarenae]UTV27904.1 O-antigen ligase family protein [Photobacterium atrarenae]